MRVGAYTESATRICPPVFTNALTLRTLAGLPVLGSISQIRDRRQLLRRHLAALGFAGSMACLFMLFALSFAIEIRGSGIHSLVMRAL